MQALIDIFLDNDLLEEVFSYLSPIDLIKIERVSKRWRAVSLKSWRNKRKLCVEKDLGVKFPHVYLEKILKRGGKYLTYLDVMVLLVFPDLSNGGLSIKYRDYPEEAIFKAISQYCQRLEVLKILVDEGIPTPTGKYLRFIESSVLQDLKSLEINIGRRFGERSLERKLSDLLRKTKKLEEFKISAELNINGSCLLSLPKTCKKLSVINCETLNEKIFTKVLDNLPNLNSLNIDGDHIEPKVVRKVCSKLETFIVGWNSQFFLGGQYKALSLKNVRVFDISQNEDVDDDVLMSLVEKVPLLEDLTAKKMENISDKGFRRLKKLEHLKFLNLSQNGQISNATLRYLGKSLKKIEKFICEECEGLTCSGLLSFIDLCENLQFLKVEPLELTDEFLKSALKLVDAREKYSPLIIDVGTAVPEKSKCLVARNNRNLKYNYCKIVGRPFMVHEFIADEGWMHSEPIIRYVGSSSITGEGLKLVNDESVNKGEFLIERIDFLVVLVVIGILYQYFVKYEYF